jgi:hypothetical protein
MNTDQDPAIVNRASGAVLGFLAACVVVLALVVTVKCFVRVPAMDADRAAVISKALAQIRADEDAGLDHVGWADKPRGIVRLPIEAAMKITEREWQDPAQARADLIAREEKATAPLPAAPVKPNPFE